LKDDPQIWVPETRAALRYVQVFLRALGIAHTATAEPAHAGSASSTSTPSIS
jgi:hypothetical protein